MRVGGTIAVKANGVALKAKGEFTYNVGGFDKSNTVMGHFGPHGYTEEAFEPFIEGEVTDDPTLNLRRDLIDLVDATVVLELANGKSVSLKDAWYSGDGTVGTREGNINVRFTGISAREF